MDIFNSIFTYIVPFLIVLSIVVFVHELGHFAVARFFKMKIDSFSIGFGKELWGFNDKHGTRWKLSLIPLGGYVKFFGDEDESSGKVSKEAQKLSEEEKKNCFHYQSVGKKLPVIAAGPLMNYIFAFFLIWGVYFISGKTELPPTVGGIMPSSAAEEAGIKVGDTILSINGKEIKDFSDIQMQTSLSVNKSLVLEVQREAQILNLTASPKKVIEDDGKGNKSERFLLGVMSIDVKNIQKKQMGFLTSGFESIKEVWKINSNTLTALGQMISGSRSSKDLGGPIRIAEITGDMAKNTSAFPDFLIFVAILSINLGLINFLPIPLLDGGHIVTYLYEIIIRRPLNEKLQEISLRLGFIFLMTIMIYATYNDVIRLVKRYFF